MLWVLVYLCLLCGICTGFSIFSLVERDAVGCRGFAALTICESLFGLAVSHCYTQPNEMVLRVLIAVLFFVNVGLMGLPFIRKMNNYFQD